MLRKCLKRIPKENTPTPRTYQHPKTLIQPAKPGAHDGLVRLAVLTGEVNILPTTTNGQSPGQVYPVEGPQCHPLPKTSDIVCFSKYAQRAKMVGHSISSTHTSTFVFLKGAVTSVLP